MHVDSLTWLHVSHCGISWRVLDVVARSGRPPFLQHKPTDLRRPQCVDPACRRLGGPRCSSSSKRPMESGRGRGREMRRDALRLDGIKDRRPSIGPGALARGPR